MKKLLIIGCRRSGTTMLASMLGAHPDIAMINEGYDKTVLSLVGKQYRGTKMTYPHFNTKRRSSRLRILLYHKLAFLNKIKWIDIRKTSMILPKDFHKIIYIVRKKEDCVNSQVKRNNVTKKRAEKVYDQFIKLIPGRCQHSKGDSYSRLHWEEFIYYEDLCKNPVETLENICAFLGLRFDPVMVHRAGFNETYRINEILNKERK